MPKYHDRDEPRTVPDDHTIRVTWDDGEDTLDERVPAAQLFFKIDGGVRSVAMGDHFDLVEMGATAIAQLLNDENPRAFETALAMGRVMAARKRQEHDPASVPRPATTPYDSVIGHGETTERSPNDPDGQVIRVRFELTTGKDGVDALTSAAVLGYHTAEGRPAVVGGGTIADAADITSAVLAAGVVAGGAPWLAAVIESAARRAKMLNPELEGLEDFMGGDTPDEPWGGR
jgi:hypothetical protein